jgi:hypothetical protein
MSRLSPIPFHSEPVLAGTLCLMSLQAGRTCTQGIAKICANLEWLATNPELSKELRGVCARLLDQWEARLSEGVA